MKILLILLVSLSSQTSQIAHYKNAIVPAANFACDYIPELNKKIIEFVTTKISKKVGRGECWDLAAEALNANGAKWDGDYGFGREINLKNECVYPGDIMQFTNVTVKYEKDKTVYTEKMQKHTAVIYEVKSSGDFILADQNTGTSGRTVGLHPLQLKNITTGKFKVYRPEK